MNRPLHGATPDHLNGEGLGPGFVEIDLQKVISAAEV